MPTIIELSDEAGKLTRSASQRLGLDPQSSMLFGLASGLDVALTLIEESTGSRFKGLTQESAAKVIDYFLKEADRSEAVDAQIAIWYRAWAEALRSEFLKK